MEPVAFYLPDDHTRLPIYDDGWSLWVEHPDGRREYGLWFAPREEVHSPIVVGGDEFPADW
jgi:hypothetical protein